MSISKQRDPIPALMTLVFAALVVGSLCLGGEMRMRDLTGQFFAGVFFGAAVIGATVGVHLMSKEWKGTDE